MTDVFGFSLGNDLTTGADQLNAMFQAIKRIHPGTDPTTLVDTYGALATTGSTENMYSDNETAAVITGQPYWSDRDLQSRSDGRGMGYAVVEAFRQYGPDFLSRMHGPFALALLIPREQRTFLAVDRLGIQPLAWHTIDKGVVFSSNAEAIQAYPLVKRGFDPQALYNYFYFHMVPSPGTIYEGTKKLLPAQFVDIRGSQVQQGFYWEAPYRESEEASADLAATLENKLRNAVERSMTSDATGAFLSGGLDSSTVAGFFSQLSDGPADAFGIGFDAKGYDEMEFARSAAQHFGIRLHEYYVTPKDVTEAVPRVAAAYDEPFGNASAIPAYFCAQFARENGKTALLAGDGGDEIFAGNARYAKQLVFDLYSRVPATIRSGILEPVAKHFPLKDRIPPLRKLHSYIQQANMPMPERLESYNFLHRTDPGAIFDRDFLGKIDPQHPIENQREAYQRANTPKMLKRMLHLDLKITLADNDLRKVSRMCELAGIKVHYPMLDEELVEFSASVPCDLLLKGNRLRDFYKNSLSDFLPPETLTKSKHGFGLPFGIWMTQDKGLRELADASLLGLRKRGFIQPAYIDLLLEAHRSEHADYYGVMIWVMMMLEQWLESHESG